MAVPDVVKAGKTATQHPLNPLSEAEVAQTVKLIEAEWPQGTGLHYKNLTLLEPEKTELGPWLDAEAKGEAVQPLERRAIFAYYIRNTDKFHESVVNLTQNKVEQNVRLGPDQHGPGDAEEIMKVEEVALKDPKVQELIAKLELPHGTVVVCDPWIYGADGVGDEKRMYQCFLYTRNPDSPDFVDSNHYAHPLKISPVISGETWEVIRIDEMPTGADHKLSGFSKQKIYSGSEYTSEKQKLRTDLKPLTVVQPEGASFTVRKHALGSEAISWQKWSFLVTFNSREGMVIHNVRYDGRPLFYRLSLSDMSIPYADPRAPFHKKSAFDLGDVGAGIMANNLQLGCDCLGSIHYMSGSVVGSKGELIEMPNAVCVHEQDAGIGWKHTNYRTGRAAVVRNRELVLQSIITVANYEYILAFVFNQAGAVEYEVRATGILSTQPIDEGVDVPWGTVVHPGVLAAHHQHIFSLRIDPMLDGSHANRLVYDECLTMERDANLNPHGVGYYTRETVVERSTGLDTDYEANRIFKIQNTASRNPVNGKPVAYKIIAPPFQKIMADASSYHRKRAEFADRSLYVVRHRERELYAAGRYTNQSRGGAGVRTWAARDEDVRDQDIVVYVQFGLQHTPRIEDWPVMPVEILKVMLKPVNFFDRNPALDVPPSTQAFNQSVLAAEHHRQPGAVEAHTNGSGVQVNGGSNGSAACCGTNGANGANGADGANGVNGANGANGTNGVNGH